MVETRHLTQTKIWVLALNPMRANTETGEIVAWSNDKDKLMNWYKALLVEPYIDEGTPSFQCHGDSRKWSKTFKKGSILEWFNPMDNAEGNPNHHRQGLMSDWVIMEDFVSGRFAGRGIW